jgi:hypothetical protein
MRPGVSPALSQLALRAAQGGAAKHGMGLALVLGSHSRSRMAMAKIKPSMRSTETYTESNFLRVQTRAESSGAECAVTIEHLSYHSPAAGASVCGWRCLTIVDDESMSKEDAIFIAKAYAVENSIPVIYESHNE